MQVAVLSSEEAESFEPKEINNKPKCRQLLTKSSFSSKSTLTKSFLDCKYITPHPLFLVAFQRPHLGYQTPKSWLVNTKQNQTGDLCRIPFTDSL